MFQANSRTERNNGILFYEQDILCLDYVFAGDMIIDFSIDYLSPGIGILLINDNGKTINEADNVYLFKLGDNSFKVIERHFLSQSTALEASCAFASSDANTNANLIFSKHGQVIELHLVTNNALTGARELRELGHYAIKSDINKYRIGFYSNAGNTLKYASIASGIPENWVVNIKNTNGGRVSFIKNGFIIEGCEYDAEIEQQEIKLKTGTYYVGFKKEMVNKENDIKCYVFKSADSQFDDVQKNILSDGKFTLNEDSSVNIKFKGTSGRITDICIKDLEDEAFIETDLVPITQEGSYIIVNLTRLKSIRWKGIINNLPDYTDYTKECPYGIVVTKHERLTKEMANIELDKEYQYSYLVKDKQLTIQRDEELYKTLTIDIREDDGNKMIVFQNMAAIINELIIVDDDDNEINILLQKTYRKYVPGTVNSPIMVVDEYDSPLDLSAAYREVVIPTWNIELFNQSQTIELKNKILNEGECVFVYGIPFGAAINLTAQNSIEDYADKYSLLRSIYYNVDYNTNTITVNPNERKLYKYIAVHYKQTGNFYYLFTLYEREIFFDMVNSFVLEKSIANVSGGVRVYGIPQEAKINSNYIYRIPDKTMVNSIDLYASAYDIINEDKYKIDFTRSEININDDIRALYQGFVIDYLKDDSFCINYLNEYGQYEVEISTDKDRIYMSYDMDSDGMVSEYKITDIRPDRNKYIVLRRAHGGS